jgi:hypothetical protein
MPSRDEVAKAVTPFQYLLNAMENAASQKRPADHDYYGKRQAVLKYVADSELRVQELREALQFIANCKHPSGCGTCAIRAAEALRRSDDKAD